MHSYFLLPAVQTKWCLSGLEKWSVLKVGPEHFVHWRWCKDCLIFWETGLSIYAARCTQNINLKLRSVCFLLFVSAAWTPTTYFGLGQTHECTWWLVYSFKAKNDALNLDLWFESGACYSSCGPQKSTEGQVRCISLILHSVIFIRGMTTSSSKKK